jgi:hypothetical protein
VCVFVCVCVCVCVFVCVCLCVCVFYTNFVLHGFNKKRATAVLVNAP